MPRANSNAGRIKLPDVFDPDGFRCVKLLIPDDDSHHHLMLRVLERYLTTQTYLERDNTREGAKLVAEAWRNALYLSKYDNNCGESESICTSFFPLSSGLFTFFPPEINEQPSDSKWNGPVWLTGTQYGNQVPWQDPLVSSDVMALWPLTLNPIDWVTNIDTDFLPRVQIRVFGSGTLEVHYLKVFQGGACLTVINGDFQSSTFNILQLGSIGNIMEDVLAAIDAALTESANPVDILEFELVGEQEHVIDIYFLPYIDVDNPFDPTAILGSGFGGGIRKIEFCGEQQLTDFRQNPTDPCLLQYRANPAAEWRDMFDFSQCDAFGGEGGSGDTITYGDLVIIRGGLGQRVLDWIADKPGYLAELNAWTPELDAVLCAALENYVRATAAIAVEIVRGERREERLLSVFVGAVTFATVVVFAPVGILGALALGVMSGVGTYVGTRQEPNETLINWLQDETAIGCITQQMYSALKGAAPLQADFQTAADPAPFPQGAAQFLAELVREASQSEEAYVSVIDLLIELKPNADLLPNNCDGDFSECIPGGCGFPVVVDFSSDECYTVPDESYPHEVFGSGASAYIEIDARYVGSRTSYIGIVNVIGDAEADVNGVSVTYELAAGPYSSLFFRLRILAFDDDGNELGTIYNETLTRTTGVLHTETIATSFTGVRTVQFRISSGSGLGDNFAASAFLRYHTLQVS